MPKTSKRWRHSREPSHIQTFVRAPRHNPGWARVQTDEGFHLPGFGHFNQNDLYHSMISAPWGTFFALIFSWYLVVNLGFAVAYYLCGPDKLAGLKDQVGIGYFLECFFFSVQTLATIGYGRINPIGLAANIVTAIEALVGVMGAAMITGLLFARFSRPTARMKFSNCAVVTEMDGLPQLNFRISNERANNVVEANILVSVLKTEVTAEGLRFRNWYDLKLERSHTPVLALSWTVLHPIDKDSPLHGHTPETLQKEQAQVYVTVWGVDENLGQTIYSRFMYEAQDIVWNAQFADMIEQLPDGTMRVDRSKLHDVVKL